MTCLPIELQAEIIDVHRYNFHQLRAMTRVCKLWRHRCNKSLFKTLQLTPSNVHRFSSLLESAFTAVGMLGHIAHLWIGGHGDRRGDWDAFRVEILQEVLISLQEAPKLSELTLMKSVSELLNLGFVTLLPLHLPHIKSLHLSDVHFSTPGEFSGFLNGFTSVQYILLKDVTVPAAWSALAMIQVAEREKPSASRFILSLHFNTDGTVNRSLRWGPSQRGTRISLRDVAVLYSSSSLGSLRAGTGIVVCPDITQIEILAKQSHESREQGHFPAVRLDLSAAYSLRYITVGSSRSVLSLLTWVPGLLSQIPPSGSMKEVRIAFASSRQFDLDQPFIRWLAGTLSGERKPFHTLESIHFMAYGTLGDEDIEENICSTVRGEFGNRSSVLKFSFSP